MLKQGMVVHVYNPITWEAEAGRLQGGQPELHSETLSQNNNKKDAQHY
jgi:hypothetical protein